MQTKAQTKLYALHAALQKLEIGDKRRKAISKQYHLASKAAQAEMLANK